MINPRRHKFKVGDILDSSMNTSYYYEVMSTEDNKYHLVAIYKSDINQRTSSQSEYDKEIIEEICTISRYLWDKEMKEIITGETQKEMV